jgi:O-antigen/teichoic acid export membrane protein
MADSLSQQTARNSFYGFLSYVVPIVFTIVITPLIIRRLGVDQYGLFVLTSVIAGFFGLFKFGLAYGVSKVVSQYHGDRKSDGVSEVLSSTLTLFTIIGLLGLIASFLVGQYGLNWLNIASVDQPAAALMFLFSGIAFFFSSINSTFTNAIAAMQRLDAYTKIYLGGMVILNGGMLLLLLAGFGVVSLVVMQASANLLLSVAYWLALRRVLPEIPVRLKYAHAKFKSYLALNAYAYLHEAASTLLFEFDKVLVSTVAGPTAVSYYNIAGTVSQKIQGTVGSLTSIAMPVASSFSASDQMDRVASIYRRTMRLVIMIAGGLAVAVVSFAPEILRYWVGPAFEINSLIPLYVLAATYFLLSLFTAFGHFVLGLGSVKQLARYTAIFAALNLIFLAVLLPKFGITGAAWAYLLCLLPLPFMIFTTERSIFKLNDSWQFYAACKSKMLIVGALGFVAARLLAPQLIHSFLGVAIGGLIWLVGYGALYRILKFMPAKDWQVLTIAFKKILKR